MDKIFEFQPLWGSWTIEYKIGDGGFGKVYKISKDLFGNKTFAAVKHFTIPSNEMRKSVINFLGTTDTKVLKKYFDEIVNEFINEINIISKLKGHSNIISFEDYYVKERDDFGYDILIRMELATSLIDYIKTEELTEKKLLKIAYDICEGLAFCHKNGVIHRDIKEENLFYSDIKRFKIGDFGVSKVSSNTIGAKTIVGTPFYLSPEVIKGNEYDNRVDIYSLGITLYKLANKGKIPFIDTEINEVTYKNIEEAENKRLNGEKFPKLKLISEEFSNIILKACSFSKDERYSNIDEMCFEISELLNKKMFNDNILNNSPNESLNTEVENETKRVTNTLIVDKKAESIESFNTVGIIKEIKNSDEKNTLIVDEKIERENVKNTIGIIKNNENNDLKNSSKLKKNKIEKNNIIKIISLCGIIFISIGIILFFKMDNKIEHQNSIKNTSDTNNNSKKIDKNVTEISKNTQVIQTPTNSLLSSQSLASNKETVNNQRPVNVQLLSVPKDAVGGNLKDVYVQSIEDKIISKGVNPEFYSDNNGWKKGNSIFSMDINGDGVKDLVSRNSSGVFTYSFTYKEKFLYQSQSQSGITDGVLGNNSCYVMDANGDYKDDLLVRYSDGNIRIMLSNGSILSSGATFATEFKDSTNWGVSNKFFVMDINGDEKDEFIARCSDGIMKIYQFDGKILKNIKEFDSEFKDGFGWESKSRFFVMDVNGDKKDDLVVRYINGSLGFYISNGLVLEKTSSQESEFKDGCNWEDNNRMIVMDVNGDKKDDLLARYSSGALGFYISNGKSLNKINEQVNEFKDGYGWEDINRFYISDINNDGKEDIIVRYIVGTFGYYKSKGNSFEMTGINLY